MKQSARSFFQAHREILLYLVFGVLTTLVGWGIYYPVLLGGRALFQIPAEEVAGGRYLALYTAAQILQWVCAVLFAFFTNRHFVFEASNRGPWRRQLLTFASSRLATLGMDYVITFSFTHILALWFPSWQALLLFGKERNLCEISSKLLAAVAVIICNYLISKLLVFRRK